jgi:hypothetical protein
MGHVVSDRFSSRKGHPFTPRAPGRLQRPAPQPAEMHSEIVGGINGTPPRECAPEQHCAQGDVAQACRERTGGHRTPLVSRQTHCTGLGIMIDLDDITTESGASSSPVRVLEVLRVEFVAAHFLFFPAGDPLQDAYNLLRRLAHARAAQVPEHQRR